MLFTAGVSMISLCFGNVLAGLYWSISWLEILLHLFFDDTSFCTLAYGIWTPGDLDCTWASGKEIA